MDIKKARKYLLLLLYSGCCFSTKAQEMASHITAKQAYLSYFKSQRFNFDTKQPEKFDYESSDALIEAYIVALREQANPVVKTMYNQSTNSLSGLNQFERRRLINSAKEEIREELANVDFDKEYTMNSIVSSVDEYYFNSKVMRVTMRRMISELGSYGRFNLYLINRPDVYIADIHMREEAAEELVNKVKEAHGAEYSIIAVNHFKINPTFYVGLRTGRSYLPAVVSKVEFFYRHYNTENKEWEYGDKIGESKFQNSIWPHPNLD